MKLRELIEGRKANIDHFFDVVEELPVKSARTLLVKMIKLANENDKEYVEEVMSGKNITKMDTMQVVDSMEDMYNVIGRHPEFKKILTQTAELRK